MKKEYLIPLIVIILIVGPAGYKLATIPPAVVSTTLGTESTSTAKPYKVNLDPADFVAVVDNPYFPLLPGSKWVYEKKRTDKTVEINTIEILPETKKIMGITAVTMHKVVTVEGTLLKETFDWYARDKKGNVWHLGEVVDNYENGVLVDHHGSWEYGVNGALPGVLMWAYPDAYLNEMYYQEYSVDEAMDLGQVLSVSESLTVPFGSFENIVITYDSSVLDADLKEYKFYAAGIGLIKVTDRVTRDELVLLEFMPSGESAAQSLPSTPESMLDKELEMVEAPAR